MKHKNYGFTIVELLIVIVVIAILAAISIVTYNGIQQRAKNTAIIHAASQSLKMIQAYISTTGTYPVAGHACITVDSGCSATPDSDTTIPSSATFNANIATVGEMPKSVPVEGTRLRGIAYMYHATNTFNGESRPAYLDYHLFGTDQSCGVPGVMRWTASNTYITSPTKNTVPNSSSSGRTLCRITIPGPAV